MRNWLVAGIGFLLVIAFAVSHLMQASTYSAPGQAAQSAEVAARQLQLATQFLDLLDEGAYQDALAMTAPAVAGALGDGKIQMIWEGLPARLGPRRSRGVMHESPSDDRLVLASRLQFRDQAMDVQLLFNERDLIAGFQLKPAEVASR